jgi:hypothetical protein
MNVPLYGDEFRKLYENMATLYPSAQDSPNMTIKVSAGGFWSLLNGTPAYIEYRGGNSPTLTAPVANAKWVIVSLNASGMLVNTDGSSAVSPVLPALPRTLFPVAVVYVESTTTALTSANVFDARPIFTNPVRSHLDLADRSTAECHPIAAIADLETTLAGLATSTTVTNGLLTKADVDGSPDVKFTLNKDFTGTPGADVYFEVERGSSTNVNLKWNETTEQWQYTNDGTTWVNLSSYYLNDGTQEIVMNFVSQAAEPTLDADQKMVVWEDSDDSDRVYLVFRRGTGDQLKVELT